MTFSHSLPCKYKTVNRIHIPFPFIGELFFQRMKSQKKNNENNSNSIYNLYAMYNLNIFFDHHLLLSSKFQSLETFTHRNKIVTKLARNLDEESHSRLRASRKQTWAEGVVDKAVEISGRIIGVRLNWLDRGSDGKIQRRNFSPSQVYILNRGGGGEKIVWAEIIREKFMLSLSTIPFFLLFRGHLKGKRKGKGKKKKRNLLSCILHERIDQGFNYYAIVWLYIARESLNISCIPWNYSFLLEERMSFRRLILPGRRFPWKVYFPLGGEGE